MPMSMNQVIHGAVRRDLNRLDVALETGAQAFGSGLIFWTAAENI